MLTSALLLQAVRYDTLELKWFRDFARDVRPGREGVQEPLRAAVHAARRGARWLHAISVKLKTQRADITARRGYLRGAK